MRHWGVERCILSLIFVVCGYVWVEKGECEGSMERSKNGTPLLSEGRGWKSVDICPDIESMEGPWRGVGVYFVFVFCLLLVGEVPTLSLQGSVGGQGLFAVEEGQGRRWGVEGREAWPGDGEDDDNDSDSKRRRNNPYH